MCVNAQIAQLVEQRTENPRVTGSIPVLGIIFIDNKVYQTYNMLNKTTGKDGCIPSAPGNFRFLL